MLDLVFAVGQFLCVLGLMAGFVLALAKWRRIHSKAQGDNSGTKLDASHNQGRPTVKLSAIPQTSQATIRVVPIENSRLLSARKAGTSAKPGRDDRKPSRRRSMSNATDRDRAGERAVLLVKHRRKRPESDGPRAV